MPMVLLATVATVIASQAVISGAFCVTRQAVQLGFLPRLTIRHTSQREIGQIYLPAINLGLFVAVVAIVLGFRSSDALASAYGVAVTGTFILNTILFLAVARMLWHKPRRLIALGGAVFLTIEVAFFAANLTKIMHGGWLPLVDRPRGVHAPDHLAQGTGNRDRQPQQRGRTAASFHRTARRARVPGSARARYGRVPQRQSAHHATRSPRQRRAQPRSAQAGDHHHDRERAGPAHLQGRSALSDHLGNPGDGITGLTARFGFQDVPDIPAALRLAAELQLLEGKIDLAQVSYFLSQITIVPCDDPGMSTWRKKLFLTMARNAANPAAYFRLPDNQTVTMGERIKL